ncbi:PREDICTED: 2'-5'-oligoadenylate synthase 2-like [Branchiostoma belcheri]|uniref:2'-5'-oligoadenylate synthase 2-like n=1 Tax=Branchiostoma belcheri TaxID=7741 RepID=A0A6P4ZPM2_BRABE|nr:PREDICTED: 2'-5'-oligoadenylate synthase 2-like [Branchiostoma belcheri]
MSAGWRAGQTSSTAYFALTQLNGVHNHRVERVHVSLPESRPFLGGPVISESCLRMTGYTCCYCHHESLTLGQALEHHGTHAPPDPDKPSSYSRCFICLGRIQYSIAYDLAVVGRTGHAVKLRVQSKKADREPHYVDLLLASDLMGPVPTDTKKKEVYGKMGSMNKHARENCSAALVELQRDFVKKQPAAVKDLIRLVKMWKKSRAPWSKLKSYSLELLCIHVGLFPGNVASAFQSVLRKLTDHKNINACWSYNYPISVVPKKLVKKRPLILDPANPYNNVVKCCKLGHWRRVANAAKKTLKKTFFTPTVTLSGPTPVTTTVARLMLRKLKRFIEGVSCIKGALNCRLHISTGKMGKKKNRDGPHKCGICSDGFSTERGVQDHRRDKHGSSGGGYYYAASSPVTIPANMNTFLDRYRPSDVHEYISQHLQTDESYRKECSDVVDRVATFFMGRPDFTLNRFIKGGSLGKGTAIKSKSDIDCVMFTSDLPSIDSDDYEDDLDTLLEWMEDQLESSSIPVEISGRTGFAVKLRVKTRKAGHASHDVDLLLAPDLLGEYTTPNGVYAMMGRLRSSERQYCSAALVELQRDFVKNQDPQVKNLIRLVKMWKASCVTESSLTSYPLELLCIHTWPSYGTVAAAFKAVLQKLSNFGSICAYWTENYSYSRAQPMLGKRPLILDPANPYNNVADRCRDWPAVAQAAQETLRKPFFSLY